MSKTPHPPPLSPSFLRGEGSKKMCLFTSFLRTKGTKKNSLFTLFLRNKRSKKTCLCPLLLRDKRVDTPTKNLAPVALRRE
jgi:hypothetical protein